MKFLVCFIVALAQLYLWGCFIASVRSANEERKRQPTSGINWGFVLFVTVHFVAHAVVTVMSIVGLLNV